MCAQHNFKCMFCGCVGKSGKSTEVIYLEPLYLFLDVLQWSVDHFEISRILGIV